MSSTGFATVGRHILKSLGSTGLYDIDLLGINYFGSFYDQKEFPYCITPARLGDPRDPYGNQMFIDALLKKEYDIVFIINDPFVVEGVARKLDEIRGIKAKNGQKQFSLVYYFPVDCRLWPEQSTMIKKADRAVAYTDFASAEAEKIGLKATDIIYHGAELESFTPLSQDQKRLLRKKYFGVTDDNTFVLINVNRNSLRKDVSKTILAFSEFHKKVPNSVLYLHMKMEDGTSDNQIVDLKPCLADLGLDPKREVIYPLQFNPAEGFPREVLNQLYNTADAYITTHLGEGFGLTILDAFCVGLPVIAPKNTSMIEIVNHDRGYLYPCKEKIYVDNSGFRPLGRTEDIVKSMMDCYMDWLTRSKRHQEVVSSAHEFVKEYSWEKIGKQWIKLFSELDGHQIQEQQQSIETI
jgi:glycosyltransferase involved in cell wall biosynthesis